MIQTRQHIILFDGLCKLCHFSVRFIIRHDKSNKFRFVSLQSAAGKALLKKAGLPQDYQTSLVYTRGRHLFLDSTAVLEILKKLNYPWKAMYIFTFIPPKLRDGVYRFIAKSRYKVFGKYQSCPIS